MTITYGVMIHGISDQLKSEHFTKIGLFFLINIFI